MDYTAPALEQLMRFYHVNTIEALVEAQAEHVDRLQKKLAKEQHPLPFFLGTPRVG